MAILSCTHNKDILLKVNHISFVSMTKLMTVKCLRAFLPFFFSFFKLRLGGVPQPLLPPPPNEDQFGFF